MERFASDLIELSTRQNFPYWLVVGSIFRGWARSAFGNTAEGISWIVDGIRDRRASGSILGMPFFLTLKAEALYFADRTGEALGAIEEAEGLANRYEQRLWRVELHRLRGVFLTVLRKHKLRLPSEQPSESHGSRSRFR